MKCNLQSCHKHRLAQPAFMDTYTLPLEHPLVTQLQGQMEIYRNEVAKRKAISDATERKARLSELGGPTAPLVLCLMETIVTRDISGVTRATIQKWIDRVEPPEMSEVPEEEMLDKDAIESQVHFLRLEEPVAKDKMKLHIAAPTWDMRRVVRAALLAEGTGIIAHTGPPPPGWMEEELETWLDAL